MAVNHNRFRVDGSMIVNPGTFRHQITWQRKIVAVQNELGEDQVEWADVVTCRAQVTDAGGREFLTADQRFAEARYRITQHYVKSLQVEMRIKWMLDGEPRYLDVLDISDPPGSGRYLVITARDFVE